MSKRWVLEGLWRGYSSSQDQVVHREVVDGSRKKFIAWAQKTFCIRYTDGTTLELSIRECNFREKIVAKHNYKSLIWDCFHYGVNSVDKLGAAQEAQRENVRLRQELNSREEDAKYESL